MKMTKIDPDGMLKINREIFSDFGKWLFKGTWLIFLGVSWIFFYLINLISPNPEIHHADRMLKIAIFLVILGVLLLVINKVRKRNQGNEKTE